VYTLADTIPLRKRAQLAWRMFRATGPGPRPGGEKSAPFAWPAWRQGTPQWQIVDLASYIADGFNVNALIYGAIMYKVRALRQAPLRAYTGDPDRPEPVAEDDPLARLLARPNPWQSWSGFQDLNTVYLNLAGNCYVYCDRPRRAALPTALYSLRPDRVYIIPEQRGTRAGLKGFLYVPEGRSQLDGIPFLPSDVMHIKLPNPGDPLEGLGYGMSPMSALAYSADVDNSITRFLKLFFEHGAVVPGLLKFDIPLDDTAISRIKERWREIYGGYENWTDIGVLDRTGTYERVGLNFEEMSFDGLDQRNESRILGPFGVPPILIGSRIGLERSTYANYKEARLACWEDTLVPELQLFKAAYRYYLTGDAGEFVAFDLSKVPALQRDLPGLVTAWAQLVNLGVPKDVAAGVVGLNIPPLPDGQVVYMPMNLMPVGSKPAALPAGTTGAASATTEERQEPKALPAPAARKLWDQETKAAQGVRVDKIARAWEPRFYEVAGAQFELDKRELLASLSKAFHDGLDQKASPDWRQVNADWQAILTAAGDRWRAAFIPVLQGLIEAQGRAWAVAIGIEFDVRNLFAEEWFRSYVFKFAEEVLTTTGDTLNLVLRQAMEEGWSIPKMQANLGTLFRQWLTGDLSPESFAWFQHRMPAYRRELIARTETIRASARGTQALYQEWGVEGKEWLTTDDDRTCPWCFSLNGKTIGTAATYYPQGGSLTVGEGDAARTMTFDYEDIEGPPLHPDCRCVLLPWKESWAGL
jgi:HK97 family phage portal protein